MNEPTVKAIVAELSEELLGHRFGKVFLISKLRLGIDFRLSNQRFLFISVEPNLPQIYLIKSGMRDLEKRSKENSAFAMQLRKQLANSVLISIEKIDNERIIDFYFEGIDEFGAAKLGYLTVQLTGRSSNLFLLNKERKILGTIRKTHGKGQQIGDSYVAPEMPPANTRKQTAFVQGDFDSLSEALETHYKKRSDNAKRKATENRARKKIDGELKRQRRLRKNLARDLETHGDAEVWKRFGELLLANAYDAKRFGDSIRVKDFFDEDAPIIEIPGDANQSITEIAESYFQKYTKARNAGIELSKRIKKLDSRIAKLEAESKDLRDAIESENKELIEEMAGRAPRKKQSAGSKEKSSESKYARSFISSDGLEILVGKRSKDNDYLTFRIARSNDTWLHAADYPGSHVVIRNKNKQDIPQNTLLEAAQIAAFYSKAKNENKAAVNYTLRKFVNKQKGAAAGLVSLSSFKTIIVKPLVPK